VKRGYRQPVGARHCLALFRHVTLLQQDDSVRRPYKKGTHRLVPSFISCVRRQLRHWVARVHGKPAEVAHVAGEHNEAVTHRGCSNDQIGQGNSSLIACLGEPRDMARRIDVDCENAIAKIAQDRRDEISNFLRSLDFPLTLELEDAGIQLRHCDYREE
jgi:hypothetical protein